MYNFASAVGATEYNSTISHLRRYLCMRHASHVVLLVSHTELTRGALPWLKTYVLRPLFNRFLVTDKYFKPAAACTSCGLCAKQCPAKDITIVAGRPAWHGVCCTGCLRCYHSCPQRAIEWGSFTKGKGQKKPCRV